MTRDADFIGLLEEYLDTFEGTTPLPQRVRDAVDAELPRIRQVHPRRSLRRVSDMLPVTPVAARWGLAATALIAVVLGAAFVAGGSPLAAPAPSPSAPPIPTSSPVALTSAATVRCSPSAVTSCIAPGTYTLGPVMPRSATVDVPAGWFEWDQGTGSVGLLVDRSDAADDSGYGVLFMRVGEVARDPCDRRAGTFPAAEVATPAALAAAIASWPGFITSAPEPVKVGDVDGLSITTRAATPHQSCVTAMTLRTDSGAEIDGYPMVGAGADGYPATFRILDVDGHLVAIRTMASAATSPYELGQGIPNDPQRHAADLVALEAIVQSLRIEAAPAP